jgi:hypothetical protein
LSRTLFNPTVKFLKIVKTRENKGSFFEGRSLEKYFGGDLLSHIVTHAVSSAQQSLTSVFGMGTGVTSAL